MRLALLGRSVVCLTSGVPSEGLNLTQFEQALSLDRPLSQVATPPVLLADYPRLRLLAQAGQVQLEFKPNAGKDLIRSGAREILRQVRLLSAPAVGFNVLYRIDAEPEDRMLAAVVREDVLAERMGVSGIRLGLRVVYPGEDSLDTLSIEPDQGDPEVWISQLNRHYARNPDEAATDRAISWLAAANDEIESLLRKVLRVEDE